MVRGVVFLLWFLLKYVEPELQQEKEVNHLFNLGSLGLL